MADLNNHEVIFHCASCHKEVRRPATGLDYLGYVTMPVEWGYMRILTDYIEFCDNEKCQDILDRSTIGFNVDNKIKS